MNPRRIFSIILRYYYLLRGSPMRIFSIYIWFAIDMVLWGFISRYLNTIATPGFNFLSAFLGAIILFDFFTRVIFGLTMTFMEDVWARNFLNIFASPLRISEYLSGLIVSSVITSGVGLILIFALAAVLFDLSPFAYGTALIPFVLILFLTGIAFGILGVAVVLRFGPSSEWMVWPIPAILSPFVGVFYPIATLPSWMQIIAHMLPPFYVFEGVRSILAGQAVPPQTLIIGIGLSILYILFASVFFQRVYRKSLKTGLIARYSAENAS